MVLFSSAKLTMHIASFKFYIFLLTKIQFSVSVKVPVIFYWTVGNIAVYLLKILFFKLWSFKFSCYSYNSLLNLELTEKHSDLATKPNLCRNKTQTDYLHLAISGWPIAIILTTPHQSPTGLRRVPRTGQFTLPATRETRSIPFCTV